jgi:hypothetical protein
VSATLVAVITLLAVSGLVLAGVLPSPPSRAISATSTPRSPAGIIAPHALRRCSPRSAPDPRERVARYRTGAWHHQLTIMRATDIHLAN